MIQRKQPKGGRKTESKENNPVKYNRIITTTIATRNRPTRQPSAP